MPNTEWAEAVGTVRDEEGYLVTGPDLGRGGTLPANWTLNREPYYLETNMPGVSGRRCAIARSSAWLRQWAKAPWLLLSFIGILAKS